MQNQCCVLAICFLCLFSCPLPFHTLKPRLPESTNQQGHSAKGDIKAAARMNQIEAAQDPDVQTAMTTCNTLLIAAATITCDHQCYYATKHIDLISNVTYLSHAYPVLPPCYCKACCPSVLTVLCPMVRMPCKEQLALLA